MFAQGGFDVVSPPASRNIMKYKSLAAISVIAITTITLWWLASEPAELNSPAPSTAPAALATPAITEAMSHVASGTITTPAHFAGRAVTNKLFRTAEALWGVPVVEESFARFKDWTQRYLATDSASREALLTEGIELAAVRRAALKELIQTNPERALELVVPSGVRAQLPAEVTSLLEERVNGRGKLDVLGVLPEPGRESEMPTTIRTATIDDQTYQTFTYGERLGVPTRSDIALNGLAVDDFLALSENALRILDSDETAAAAAANPDPFCSVTAQSALVVQHSRIRVLPQVRVAVLQASVVQSAPSSQSALV